MGDIIRNHDGVNRHGYNILYNDFKKVNMPTFKNIIKQLNERPLSDKEKQDKERIVLSLKKKKAELRDRYGDDWKNVMYAIATKSAKNKSDKRKM